MANENKNDLKSTESTESEALLIDQFEVIELENRLELAGRCNNCKPQ